MKYLLVCNHHKQIVDCSDGPVEAQKVFQCKKCAGFVLEDSKWRFTDIRIYPATKDDIRLVDSGLNAEKRKKPDKLDQLDWVG